MKNNRKQRPYPQGRSIGFDLPWIICNFKLQDKKRAIKNGPFPLNHRTFKHTRGNNLCPYTLKKF